MIRPIKKLGGLYQDKIILSLASNQCQFGNKKEGVKLNISPPFFSETSAVNGTASENIETATDPDSESDEEEDEAYPALGDALTQLGLPEYIGLFESEEMDMETFVS